MLMRTKTKCYTTMEMIEIITGTKPVDLKGICQLRPQLTSKGIKLKLDGTGLGVPEGLDITGLDDDCEQYLREHPELLKEK